jgi:predicted DCC family thiol-disulfide oxidoreductase YuxK
MPDDHPIILFDGVCNLCSASVQFICRRDPAGRFRFASLQSSAARQTLSRFPTAPRDISTIAWVQGDKLLIKSDAVLEIVRRLKMPWSLLYSLKIVPRPLRDAAYDFIASRRYRWFGRTGSCMVPTPELRSRFLE